MKKTLAISASRRIQKVSTAALILLTILFSVSARGAGLTDLKADEVQRLGERMYRDGILPSGEPIQATLKGDVKVPGSAFSCESCHLRSGIGSIEGQIVSPPTNWLKLSKPYYKYEPILGDHSRVMKGMYDGRAPAKPVFRPSYTYETLVEALLLGVSPTGREFNSAMPRYVLEDRDMDILIAYLKTLSAELSPGVDPAFKYIRFATVIAGDVPADERKEMLAVLDSIIDQHNSNARKRNRRLNMGTHMQDAAFNYPRFTLARWELKGTPDTWRAQLEEYYRKEPVFALLGGISVADWRPMHEFSEQNKIPCLLPITDLPVVSDSDWYTLYFNKGMYQEGDTAARYLAMNSESASDAGILQVVEDTPRARAVAAGFLAAWKDLGRGAPETVNLPPGQTISAEMLRSLTGSKRSSTLLLWTAAGTLPALGSLAEDKGRPGMVFVSSSLLDRETRSIPEAARGFTYISYPYRLDPDTVGFRTSFEFWLKKRTIPVSDKRIATRLFSLTNVLLEPFATVKRDFNPGGMGQGQVNMEDQFESLMHVKRNYYRDYLFDVIGMFGDKGSLDYERLSFGPGQRYMSKGCYIVQLSPGPKPELVKRSDWVIF
jgi:hypothetical protein